MTLHGLSPHQEGCLPGEVLAPPSDIALRQLPFAIHHGCLRLCLLALTLLPCAGASAQSGDETPSHQEVAETAKGTTGSSYIPLDSWIYSSAIRLYELVYLKTA